VQDNAVFDSANMGMPGEKSSLHRQSNILKDVFVEKEVESQNGSVDSNEKHSNKNKNKSIEEN